MQEKDLVNPQLLLKDNYSAAAEQNIDQILELRAKGELMVVWRCSDARLMVPNDVYQIGTISGTGPRSPWTSAINYEKITGVMVLDHFYCGGLQARAQLPEKISDEDTALGFVKDHVWAKDPIVQSILTGSWTASRTRKPVLSVVQNPLTGVNYTQGAFNNGSQIEYKTLPTYKLMPEEYLPEKIYGNEIPVLEASYIPECFAEALTHINDKKDNILADNPGFLERQQIQDPQVVAVTTNLKPFSARFPQVFGIPNSVFFVSLKRQSLDDEGELESRDVKEAFRQVHYPISHSIENNHLESGTTFKNTRIIYLETGDMRVSVGLAKQLKRRLWVQEWLDLPNRSIIAAETIKGKIQQIEQVV